MYKITIQKIETYEKVVQGDWTIVDERPYTDDELKESGIYSQASKNQIKQVRGYAPDVKKTFTNEVKVLEQTVNDLDLVEVIKSINGIK